MRSEGTETSTFRLVVQCLIQLRHSVWGSSPGRRKRFFSAQKTLSVCEVQLASHSFGTMFLSQGVKPAKVEVDHFPPSSAKARNKLSCTYVPPIYL